MRRCCVITSCRRTNSPDQAIPRCFGGATSKRVTDVERLMNNPFKKTMNNTDHCIDVCNKLLRGERSAVETYDQAIGKHGDKPVMDELRVLRQDHAEAVRILEDNVRSMGGSPDQEAGAWGAFANTVQAAANLMGPNSALEALQKGEQAGKRDYENALKDDEVMPECKNLFNSRLLPTTMDHISTLERLQAVA